MTDKAIQKAVEDVYASLHNGNEDLDPCIDALKAALAPGNAVTVESARLAENNRQGRRLMQAYFKKRGVVVEFG